MIKGGEPPGPPCLTQNTWAPSAGCACHYLHAPAISSKMAPTEGQVVGSTKINLSMLIDFLLQKTYHELTVLSELWVYQTNHSVFFFGDNDCWKKCKDINWNDWCCFHIWHRNYADVSLFIFLLPEDFFTWFLVTSPSYQQFLMNKCINSITRLPRKSDIER